MIDLRHATFDNRSQRYDLLKTEGQPVSREIQHYIVN